jgi:hypothetical protein
MKPANANTNKNNKIKKYTKSNLPLNGGKNGPEFGMK